MVKPSHSSFSLLLIFFSLLALFLLSLPFLCSPPPLLKDPIPKFPNSSPLVSLITHEPTIPNYPFTQRSNLSNNGSSSKNRNTRLDHFSARVTAFFNSNNHHASSCELRFFMTWISTPRLLGPRERLSIESVFRSHPNACLLVLSDAMDSASGARLLDPFVENGFRVSAISPNFTSLFKNTPAKHWYQRLRNGGVEAGAIIIGQNLSNLARLVLLYKYGGIYLDTDVIVMKSFAGLKNVIGAQTIGETGNWSRLNNAVLVFDRGHPLLYWFIKEFVISFDGNVWGHNGPYLVSRVVSRVEGKPGFEDFSVMLPEVFYPVGWHRIGGMFKAPSGGRHSRWVSAKYRWIREVSFAVHLWNRESRGMEVEEGSIIGRIMVDCCMFCSSVKSAMEVARES